MKPNLVTGGALAALAAALAFVAAPAAAKPNDDQHQYRQNRGHEQSSDDSGQRARSWTGGQHTSEPQGNAQAQPAHEQRSWTPTARQEQHDWNQQGRQQQRNWTSQARQQQQPNWTPQVREQQQRQYNQRSYSPPVQQAERTQNWNGQRSDRNRTYSDPNRNTTYRNAYRGNDRDWRGNDGDHRQWDRNWRGNNRYDWQRYRSSNRNVYHVGRYYAPYRNYSYRRLSIGFALDPLFFGQDYWIGDPGYYRLPDVYGPYRWVRYYDDALLVDIYSGEVVDVIYDFFW